MTTKVETSSLLKQTSALGNYLDEMLHDATQIATETAEQPVNIVSPESALLAEVAIDEVIPEGKCLTALDTKEKYNPSHVFDIPESQVVDVVPEENKFPAQLKTCQFPIQCLMFRVGDNLLALPLIQMAGVVPWRDEFTHLPRSPDWMFGLLRHRECNLRVLDSSKVLGIPAITGQTPGHILALADSEWAISCDMLEDVVTLEYGDIQWHQLESNTVTLGTIRETLAYLLCPSGIINSLKLTDAI